MSKNKQYSPFFTLEDSIFVGSNVTFPPFLNLKRAYVEEDKSLPKSKVL